MARTKITSTSKDLISDDGNVLISLVKGEQVRTLITVGWVANLTGYTIVAKIVEAANVGDEAVPFAEDATVTVTTLPIIDTTPSDNQFEIVFPATLVDSWDIQPTPDKPVYGYIGLEISDTGVGNLQQVWKPMRGLVEVRYSPTETV